MADDEVEHPPAQVVAVAGGEQVHAMDAPGQVFSSSGRGACS
ncbi:MAG TPA: hypothetical protein VI011_11705 [Asanoa sp.]